MTAAIIAALIVLAYLIGSIPFGLLISKWMAGKDPRQSGSGNMGATNVFRVVGKKEAILTLSADIIKGMIPIGLASFGGIEQRMLFFIGFSAILGHIFPIFLGFKGGKGVSVSFGVFLSIAPKIALSALIVWMGAFKIWHYSSAGALAAFGVLPVLALWLKPEKEFVLFSIVVSVLVYFCHRGNIVRLMRGEEKSS
ncbi:MAG: glycerol-3-phosphate 1-O-acyltransferase PlsY [Nitrospirota bacterium]